MGSEPATDGHLARALELAFRQLNRRERTVGELRRHLLSRDLEPDGVEAALGRLLEDGYLDDARFARLFAEDKRSLEQWGSERIRRALIARGVDRDLIEAALNEEAPEGELERARAVLRRRFPAKIEGGRVRERALAVLLRKGYDYELAREALTGGAEE